MDRNPGSGNDDTVVATGNAAQPAEPAPPSLARYKTGGVIGRGGMGEVVSARDEQIGRNVAIKRLRAKDAGPELTARFLREARIQGRLDHPAIVPVHELSTDGAEPFFVMKQLSGTTLGDVIASTDKKFTRQELLRAFVDVCLAIEFAHTHGVVHRDLKPANIMLGDFGEVYVLDWGIARVTGDPAVRESFRDVDTADGGATVVGAVLGTPGYMSPEQVRGDADLDGRSDVYALGCILFEILTGKALHPRGQAALASALAGIEAKPSARAPDVPPELDTICERATATDREARYQTARALADSVRSFLDGDRDLARRKELAAVELGHARDAMDKNATTDALRAAARALALDPSAPEPAELVGRLMLEPPKETPPEVQAELAELDLTELTAQARRGGMAVISYVVFVPIMYLGGIHPPWFVASVLGLSAIVLAITRILVSRPSMRLMWVGIIANALFVPLFAQTTSPILIAPTIAMVNSSMFAMHPRVGTAWGLSAVFSVAALVPWLAELVDLAPRMTTLLSDGIVIHAATTGIDPFWITLGLTLYLAGVPFLVVWMARAIALDRRKVQRALHLQSWQLRQLVPR